MGFCTLEYQIGVARRNPAQILRLTDVDADVEVFPRHSIGILARASALPAWPGSRTVYLKEHLLLPPGARTLWCTVAQ